MGIRATYYDGRTSRPHAVEFSLRNKLIAITGEFERNYYFEELQVPERLRRDFYKLTFTGGGYLEVVDAAAYHAFLSSIGHREARSVKMQRSWRGALLALGIMFAILVPGYLYGLPAASNVIAKRLPEKVQQSIGRETLSFLDKRLFEPSVLPLERQQALIDRFTMLRLPKHGTPTYEILFRKSKIGPNAFALPSGQIVLTDEMVSLLGNDDAVMGVLAHELGHLHERHLLRRIIQGSVVGLMTTVLFGDVSSLVAAIPTTMLDLKYSRDAEREADEYAIVMMKINGISLEGLSLTFEKLGEKSVELNAYLSSHPPATERIDRIKKAE